MPSLTPKNDGITRNMRWLHPSLKMHFRGSDDMALPYKWFYATKILTFSYDLE